MTQTTADLKRRLANGELICNVGNWAPAARAWVKRAYERGEIERRCSGYPDGRWAYYAA